MPETERSNESSSPMKRLVNAFRRRPLITTGFVLALVMALMFAARSVVFMLYWSDPDRYFQEIEGWMTPRYVAQSWHLPRDVMFRALGQEKMPGRRKTLSDIAAEQGITLEELEQRIIDAAARYRETRP